MMTVEIVNDMTGNSEVGNYDVRVLVNGFEIWSGRVEGHRRADDWPELLAKIAGRASGLEHCKES